jgi:hypothetical protein
MTKDDELTFPQPMMLPPTIWMAGLYLGCQVFVEQHAPQTMLDQKPRPNEFSIMQLFSTIQKCLR